MRDCYSGILYPSKFFSLNKSKLTNFPRFARNSNRLFLRAKLLDCREKIIKTKLERKEEEMILSIDIE